MDLLKIGKAIITGGASIRLEHWAGKYEAVRSQVQEAFDEMEVKRAKTNQAVESLVSAKKRAIRSLKKVRTISRNVKARERDVTERNLESVQIDLQLARVENTISQNGDRDAYR